MKKGNIGINSVENVKKVDSKIKKILKIFAPIVLTMTLIILLLGLMKNDNIKIIEEWKEKYNDEIVEILEDEYNITPEAEAKLINIINENEKSHVIGSFETEDGSYIIVKTPLDEKYQSLSDIAKNDAEIEEEKSQVDIMDMDEFLPSKELLDFAEIAFGAEVKNKLENITCPADGFCVVNPNNKTFEFFFTKNEKECYTVKINEEIPDEYFGDFKHMIEYVESTKSYKDSECIYQLNKYGIIAVSSDWNLTK